MTPQLFESIMFLKYNSEYWDPYLVGEAIKLAKTTRSMDVYQDQNEG